MTIKEVKQRLCAKCTECPRQMRVYPVGFDDEGHILYRRWAGKCQLKPITEDGKECPYFKEIGE